MLLIQACKIIIIKLYITVWPSTDFLSAQDVNTIIFLTQPHPPIAHPSATIMSLLFARSIRHQSAKVRAFWYACRHESLRCIVTSAGSMDLVAPRGVTFPKLYPLAKSSFQNVVAIATTTNTSLVSIGANFIDSLQSLLGDMSTWLIKRTYQPSIIRKRRKHGFMRRKESVGGRRVLKRRLAKGRMRLGGSWCRFFSSHWWVHLASTIDVLHKSIHMWWKILLIS